MLVSFAVSFAFKNEIGSFEGSMGSSQHIKGDASYIQPFKNLTV